MQWHLPDTSAPSRNRQVVPTNLVAGVRSLDRGRESARLGPSTDDAIRERTAHMRHFMTPRKLKPNHNLELSTIKVVVKEVKKIEHAHRPLRAGLDNRGRKRLLDI